MLARSGTMIRKKRRTSSKKSPAARGRGDDAPGRPTTPQPLTPGIPKTGLLPHSAPSSPVPRTRRKSHEDGGLYLKSPALECKRTISCYVQVDPVSNHIHSQLVTEHDNLRPSNWTVDLASDHSSYGSIFLQIQEANYESEDTIDFVRKTLDIIYGTLPVTVMLGMCLVLPVAMVAVGVKYLNECPLEQRIPIYLLVGGCVGLLRHMCVLCRQIRSRHSQKMDQPFHNADGGDGDIFQSKSTMFTERILSLFLLVWFIFGNYWVFKIWQPNFKQSLHEPSQWCDKTVYLFSVGQIAACYIAFVIFVCVILILLCCHCCTSRDL